MKLPSFNSLFILKQSNPQHPVRLICTEIGLVPLTITVNHSNRSFILSALSWPLIKDASANLVAFIVPVRVTSLSHGRALVAPWSRIMLHFRAFVQKKSLNADVSCSCDVNLR